MIKGIEREAYFRSQMKRKENKDLIYEGKEKMKKLKKKIKDKMKNEAEEKSWDP
ncbi:hypothetical protein KI387_024837, partial [Taxus chinensis]